MNESLLRENIDLDSKPDIVKKYLKQIKDKEVIEDIVQKTIDKINLKIQNLEFDLNDYYNLELTYSSRINIEEDFEIAQRIKDVISSLDFQINFDYSFENKEYVNPYIPTVRGTQTIKVLNGFNFHNFLLDSPNYLVIRLQPKNDNLPIGEIINILAYSQNKMLIFQISFLLVKDGKGSYKEIKRSDDYYEIVSYDKLEDLNIFSNEYLLEKISEIEVFITDYMLRNYLTN